jgi:uncharacterized protein YggU (UPF0235/DUF167 family)
VSLAVNVTAVPDKGLSNAAVMKTLTKAMKIYHLAAAYRNTNGKNY